MNNPHPHYIIRLGKFVLGDYEARDTSYHTDAGNRLEDALDAQLKLTPNWKLINVFVAQGNAFGVYIDTKDYGKT